MYICLNLLSRKLAPTTQQKAQGAQALAVIQRPVLVGQHNLALPIGALTIRRGFWGPLYFNYNKEPPKIVLVSIKARILGFKVPLRVPLWHGPELSSFMKWEFPKVRVP